MSLQFEHYKSCLIMSRKGADLHGICPRHKSSLFLNTLWKLSYVCAYTYQCVGWKDFNKRRKKAQIGPDYMFMMIACDWYVHEWLYYKTDENIVRLWIYNWIIVLGCYVYAFICKYIWRNKSFGFFFIAESHYEFGIPWTVWCWFILIKCLYQNIMCCSFRNQQNSWGDE